MLEISRLDVSYGLIAAVRELSFEVRAGQLVALIGPNGAGKTSTLMAISGVAPVTCGEILFEGERIDRLPSHHIYARGIVQVPEGRLILSAMSVMENLRLGADYGARDADFEARLEQALGLFPELRPRLRDLAGVLSGGQMQMLAIARGLMAAPRLLMLDEPSLGLAPILSGQLFDAIARLRESGLTILLVEQNVHAAMNMCDHAILMDAGGVRWAGEPCQIMDNPSIRDVYLGHGAAAQGKGAPPEITMTKG